MRVSSRVGPYVALTPVLVGVFIAADDQTVVVTVLPQIMLDMRVMVTELDRVSWTITGYLLGYLVAMPLIGHRQPAFIEEVKAVCGKLKAFFLTDAYTLFENCPATALMDASVRNLVGERILHCVGGAFAERWFAVSEACGRKPEALSVEWGEVVTPDALREKLTSSPPFEAVAITYNETSTGARAPLKELAAVVREVAPEALILVDAVSAVGGIELRFDAWGIDLAFAGTQKCLALPPGLCVYALSERAMEKAKTVPDRGFLWDFERAAKGLAAGKASATPNVPLVFALSRQLDRIADEGIENRWQRHLDMLAAVTSWAAERGFEFLVDEAYRSPTVAPHHLDPPAPTFRASRSTRLRDWS